MIIKIDEITQIWTKNVCASFSHLHFFSIPGSFSDLYCNFVEILQKRDLDTG
jgi:hypothetical protein